MRDSKAEFQFLDFTRHSVKSDAPEASFEDIASKLHATEEPTNAELGIVPYPGWVLMIVWLSPVAVAALAWWLS